MARKIRSVSSAFAREVLESAWVFADLYRKFCFQELALFHDELSNIQQRVYCELVIHIVIPLPSCSLKIMLEGYQVAVDDWGMNWLNVGGVRHSDWPGVLTLEILILILLLLLECSMAWREVVEVGSWTLIDLLSLVQQTKPLSGTPLLAIESRGIPKILDDIVKHRVRLPNCPFFQT